MAPPTLYIMLQREKAGLELVIDQEHLRRELPPEEHLPGCGVLGQECGPSPVEVGEANLDNLLNWPAVSTGPTWLICPLLGALLGGRQ